MKCKSCDAEINPKWTYAIDQNICPFCGELILDEQFKDSLSTLHNIISSLSDYSEQLNDWMLSNFNYIKTDSPDLINYLPEEAFKNLKVKPKKDSTDKQFLVKVKTEDGEQEVVAEKIQTEEETNDFFKRAEVVKPRIDGFSSTVEKTKHIKEMAQKIKKAGLANMQMTDVNVDEEVADDEPQEEDEVPNFVLAMANQAKNNGNGYSSASDLLKLQKMQEKMQASRENFASGENRGSNGFSRSG